MLNLIALLLAFLLAIPATVDLEQRQGGIFDYNRGYQAREMNYPKDESASADWLLGWERRDRETKSVKFTDLPSCPDLSSPLAD